MVRLLFIVILTLFVSSCEEGSSDTAVVVTPPVVEDYDSTLDTDIKGKDDDDNGIRDDIDELLETKHSGKDSFEFREIEALAKLFQESIVDALGKETRINRDRRLAYNCLLIRLPSEGEVIYREIHDSTYNTLLRYKAYDAFNANFLGKIQQFLEDENIEQYCNRR